MNDLNLHDGHRQRTRKEFIDSGLLSFSDVRALELLLFYAIGRKDTNPIAHSLLNRFGSLHNVFSASIEELCDIEGISESSAVLIKLIPALNQKAEYLHALRNNPAVTNSSSAYEILRSSYVARREELLVVLLLDTKKKIIKMIELAEGTSSGVEMNMKKLVEVVITNKADSCIISHNHPDDDLFPSSEDIRLTSMVTDVLSKIGVSLVDHLIIGNSDYYSFADSGRI